MSRWTVRAEGKRVHTTLAIASYPGGSNDTKSRNHSKIFELQSLIQQIYFKIALCIPDLSL